MIDPASLAFDIDDVFADTMALFIDIARNEYHVSGIDRNDITSYSLKDCLDMDEDILEGILTGIEDGTYTASLKPLEGAPEVLTRLARNNSRILFVTARPHLGPIYDWILKVLPLDPSSVEVVATGTFDGKAQVLLNRNISYFVEDRLETCFSLQKAGVMPVLFKQPWNRKRHPFIEVGNWSELASLIGMDDQPIVRPAE